MLASQLRQDVDGAFTQCVLHLRFTGPNLSADASLTMLSAVGVSCAAHQHLAVEEHLSVVLANELEDGDLVVLGELVL